MPPLLVLYDIDGTLLTGGSIALDAMHSAMQHVYGIPAATPFGPVAGSTDDAIVLSTLVAAGLAEQYILDGLSQFRTCYLSYLEGDVVRLGAHIQVLPGVRDLLRQVHGLDAVQTVLTGNFQQSARLKLRLAELDKDLDLDCGAFGSDNRDRCALVPIARARTAKKYGTTIPEHHCIVIGDTPSDVACARAGGARVIAVATGKFTLEELTSHQPDMVITDLTDTAAIVATIATLNPR